MRQSCKLVRYTTLAMKRLLPLLLLLTSCAALAESGSYRVEIIIFENLAVAADAAEVDAFQNFSRFPDMDEINLPDDLVVLEQKSSFMDGVWRRLRSSRAYRPLVFAAWLQNRTDYYPPMRIHNEILLDQQLLSPTNIMIAELEAEDPLAAYMSTFYQLDGTLQLRRSRFLHLHLDLELRQQNAVNVIQPSFFSDVDTPEPSDVTQRKIFSLQQNRQIRSGRLHYFDTPHFGALVFVSAISAD